MMERIDVSGEVIRIKICKYVLSITNDEGSNIFYVRCGGSLEIKICRYTIHPSVDINLFRILLFFFFFLAIE